MGRAGFVPVRVANVERHVPASIQLLCVAFRNLRVSAFSIFDQERLLP